MNPRPAGRAADRRRHGARLANSDLYTRTSKEQSEIAAWRGTVSIVEDYDAIARRLRELKAPTPKSADAISDMERWRDLARETARTYLENRRRSATYRRFYPRPTD